MKMKLGIMGAMLVGGTAFAADGIKLGGFVNASYEWAAIKGGADTNTFMIPDGAIYLGKTLGAGEVMIDIPFRANVQGVNNQNLLAGFDKAQAYVSWKYENGFNWKLGQFDSLYGFEANDAADRFFSHTGIIYAVMPVVHTGLTLGYNFSDALAVTFLVANHNDRGIMTAGNPDFGVKVATTADGIRASAGFLMQSDQSAKFNTVGGVPYSGQKGWLIDVLAGTTMDLLSADLEAKIAKGKDLNGVTGTGDKTQFGMGLHLAYGLTETIKAGLRGEWLKTDVSKVFGFAIGPKFSTSKDLDIGLQYYFAKYKNTNDPVTGAAKDKDNMITVSAIHRF